MEFDRAKWETGRGQATTDNPRSDMIKDARAAGVAPGAMRMDVIALLGQPDTHSSARDNWYLGRSPSAPDFRVLTVQYDGRGVVTEVTVKTI